MVHVKLPSKQTTRYHHINLTLQILTMHQSIILHSGKQTCGTDIFRNLDF